MSFSLKEIQKISKLAKASQAEIDKQNEKKAKAEALADALRVERELQTQLNKDKEYIERGIKGAALDCKNNYTYQLGKDVEYNGVRVKALMEIFKEFNPTVKTEYEKYCSNYELDRWEEYPVTTITFRF